MSFKRLLVFALIIGLVGCAASRVTAPSQSDVDRMKSKYPDYTLEDLNRGKTLYEANCNKCHDLVKPSSESEQEWERIVPNMVNKVNRNGVVLDDKAQQNILRYLITMSTAKRK